MPAELAENAEQNQRERIQEEQQFLRVSAPEDFS
jgi:hypothetical protein